MKVLLTSCGLETKGITNKFLEFITKDISKVKALYIPTAANSCDAIDMLPKCMHDLLKCGISKENITVYDLHTPMTPEKLLTYDMVYLCGGDPAYLLNRVNEAQFDTSLQNFIKEGHIVLGVSAGSMIFATNMEHNLGLLPRVLYVHCEEEDLEPLGPLDLSRVDPIRLSNNQAIIMEDDRIYVID